MLSRKMNSVSELETGDPVDAPSPNPLPKGERAFRLSACNSVPSPHLGEGQGEGALKTNVLFLAFIVVAGLFAWAAPASADIAVSRQDCDRLVKYQEPPGVEYQPGVDVHGQPVVPADINGGSKIQLPETIVIPVEALLRQYAFIPPGSPLRQSKAELGAITVTGDQVFYNGQPLTDQDDAALAAACREQLPYK